MVPSDYSYSEDEANDLVERFQKLIDNNESAYFDPEEMEIIADAFLRKENLSMGKSAIDFGLRLYPDNEELQILDIHYHVLDNMPERAEQMALTFIDRFPENVEAYLVLASVKSDRGNHHEALSLLEKAYDIDPESEHVITSLSMEYQAMGMNRKAILLYRQMLERDPADDFALNELIFVYEAANEISEAIHFLKEFTDKYPFNQQAWFHLANVHNINNEPLKAIEAYDYSLAIDPAFTPSLFGKGHSYMMAGDHLKAVDCFRETAESDGFKAASYFSLGEAFSQMNNFGSASDYYLKSLEIDSFYTEARIGLANSLFMLGLDDEALRHVNEAILADPERADSYQLKGAILMNMENYTDAITEFRNALRADKDDEDIWLDLSEAWHYKAGIDEAMNILLEADEVLNEENALIIYRKAALLFEAGRNQEAVSQLLIGLSANADSYTSIYSYNRDLEKNEIIQEIVTMFLNQ